MYELVFIKLNFIFLRLNTFIENNTCMYVKKW